MKCRSRRTYTYKSTSLEFTVVMIHIQQRVTPCHPATRKMPSTADNPRVLGDHAYPGSTISRLEGTPSGEASQRVLNPG